MSNLKSYFKIFFIFLIICLVQECKKDLSLEEVSCIDLSCSEKAWGDLFCCKRKTKKIIEEHTEEQFSITGIQNHYYIQSDTDTRFKYDPENGESYDDLFLEDNRVGDPSKKDVKNSTNNK